MDLHQPSQDRESLVAGLSLLLPSQKPQARIWKYHIRILSEDRNVVNCQPMALNSHVGVWLKVR